nr:CDP-alcohol phosphatidyltransferase family protein [Sedimentibacter sp.]
MLDTYGRKYIDKFFNKTADYFLKRNLKPNDITVIALILGVSASVFFYFENYLVSIILLWVSGYLDAVDGAMARKNKSITKTGTLLDICFDRIVEIIFIIVFALKHANAVFALLCLACTIVLSMSIFLTSGMLIENKGKKSFYYQAGLMERTEGFIMFTLMIIFNKYMKELSFFYAALILFTAGQRLISSINILEGTNEK